MTQLHPATTSNMDGECLDCGAPGIIGISCAFCSGDVVALADSKDVLGSQPGNTDGRYTAGLLDADDDDPGIKTDDHHTVSLEQLAEEESATTDNPSNPDDTP